MSEEVIEKCDGWTHGGKLCKCNKCGDIVRCTPEFDFYAFDDGDPLECERCFRVDLKDRGLTLGEGFGPVVDPRN